MKTFYTAGENFAEDETYEDALKRAKKEVQNNHEDRMIFKAVAVVKYPVPDYEIVTL